MKNIKKDKDVICINENIFKKSLSKLFIFIEKLLKFLFLKSQDHLLPLALGTDITKSKYYKNADILHIHWFSQGFIQLRSLSRVNKPVVWTMRDMWPFTGGSHYSDGFPEL